MLPLEIRKCMPKENVSLEEGEWMPEEVSSLLDGGGITINQVHAANHDEIIQDLKESMDVAITVIDVHGEFMLLCLTSRKFIHVFKPDSKSDIRFLKKALRCPHVEFHTVRGFIDSHLIRSCLGIALENLETMNLESLDMYISMTNQLSYMFQSRATLGFVHDHVKLRWLTTEQLIEKYLKTSVDFTCTDEELLAAYQDPFSVLGRSAIRKRAALSYKLAMTILNKYNSMRNQASRNIYSIAKLSDKTREDYERFGTQDYADLCYWLGNEEL